MTGSSVTTINVAIGFVDIVGYTHLSTTLAPDRLASFISNFEARAVGLVKDQGGRLVKLIGDAVMFVAVEPDEAVAVANAILHEFAGTDALPRAGIASGEVIAVGGDYYGELVNLASRMADLAVPGEVLVDEATAHRALTHRFDGAGRRQLKGFADPIALLALQR